MFYQTLRFFFILTMTLGLGALPSTARAVTTLPVALSTEAVLEAVNEVRVAHALPTLELNQQLTAAADSKAAVMATHSLFAHTLPSGQTAWHFIGAAGYRYQFAGENLALYYDSAESVVAAWLRSPSHRANLLSTHFTEMGVGVQAGTWDGYDSQVVVQLLASPL